MQDSPLLKSLTKPESRREQEYDVGEKPKSRKECISEGRKRQLEKNQWSKDELILPRVFTRSDDTLSRTVPSENCLARRVSRNTRDYSGKRHLMNRVELDRVKIQAVSSTRQRRQENRSELDRIRQKLGSVQLASKAWIRWKKR